MIAAYLDSSVVMRMVLNEPNPLREWNDLEFGVASSLLRVECYRTLDRYWLTGELDQEELADKRSRLAELLRYLEVIVLRPRILNRASESLPVVLGTLDAIHLVSALSYRETRPKDERPLLFATHDKALARAAEAMRFDVIGV